MGPDIQAQCFLGVWGWGSWYLGDSLLTEMTQQVEGKWRQRLCRPEGQTHRDWRTQLLLLPGTLRPDTELELCSLDREVPSAADFFWGSCDSCIDRRVLDDWATWEAQILLLYYLKPCMPPTPQNHSQDSYNIWQRPEQHWHPTHPQAPPHPHLVLLRAHRPTGYYLDTPDLLLPSAPCTSCTFGPLH